MKKILTLVALAALFSCEKGPVQPKEFRLSKSICIRVSSPTKTVFDNNLSSVFKITDTLVVYDDKNVGVKFSTKVDSSSTWVFTTDKWTGDNPSYAVNVADVDEVTCQSPGVFGISIPSEQVVSRAGAHAPDAFANVGKVLENEGNYFLSTMKIVPGYFKIKIEKDNVASVRVESCGSEYMSGDVEVDCNLIETEPYDFWRPFEGGEQKTYSELRHKETYFDKGYHYVAVLPQKYSGGVNLTLSDKEGNVVVSRPFGALNGIPLRNGAIYELDPNSLVDTYPDEVVLDMDFNQNGDPSATNPLGFGTKSTIKFETTNVWKYEYKYMYGDTPMTDTFDISITDAGKNYQYATMTSYNYGSGKLLFMNTTGSYMKLPGIPGKVLKSVSIAIENAAFKEVRICPSPDGSSYIACTHKTDANGQATYGTGILNAQTMEFPYTFPETHAKAGQETRTEMGQPYYIYMAAASNHIFYIRAVYTNSLE